MFLLLLISIGIVAFLYSAVGHGGASGYIAVFSLLNFTPLDYKPIVLILNVLVASIAFFSFYNAGYFKSKLTFGFIAASIPMAFLGAKIPVPLFYLNLLLGAALIFAALQLFLKSREIKKEMIPETEIRNPRLIEQLGIGSIIGLISGILSIGGGIFLSPVIILNRWADVKTTAATSSFFIVANSIAGLATLKLSQVHFSGLEILSCLTSVLIFGVLGSRLGSKIFKQSSVQQLLSVTLFFAGVKLLFFTR